MCFWGRTPLNPNSGGLSPAAGADGKGSGAAAGAVFTGKVNGVYSGANAAEATFRYNYLSHKQKG